LSRAITITRIRLLSVARFSNCLSVMLGASIGLVRALDIIADSDPDGAVCLAADKAARLVEAGHSLSTALDRLDGVFEEVYVRMVLAGENSGKLPEVLHGLGKDAEQRSHQASAIKSAIIYPASVFSVSLGMIFFMVFFMLPKFLEFFEGMGSELPFPTRLLIFVVYNPALRYGLGFLLLLFLAVGYYLSHNKKESRSAKEYLKYNLPLLGRVNLLISVSHFCRHLCMLGTSGVVLTEGLKILKLGSGYEKLNRAITNVREKIVEGDSFSDALATEPLFPPILIHSVRAAEEGSNLYGGLERASNLLSEEGQSKIDGLIPLLEPLIMAFMGILVGFIVLATFLPIYQLVAVEL